MPDNLLNQDPPAEPLFDPNKNYYEDLVGQDKKFKDNETLAKAKVQSDIFIKHLERQQDELRKDYLALREDNNAKAKLQDYIDKISKLPERQSNSELPPANDDNQPPRITPEDIDLRVTSKIQEIETQRRQSANANLLREKLTERFGDNYQASVKQQVDALGMSDEQFNTLARTNPQVLIKAFGLDTVRQQDPNILPRNVQRSDNFKPQDQRRTRSYYLKLKANDPKLYHDIKTSVQMNRDAVELGESFFDVEEP